MFLLIKNSYFCIGKKKHGKGGGFQTVSALYRVIV